MIVLLWILGVLVALVGLLLFAMYARGSFSEKIEHKLAYVPPVDHPCFPLAAASFSTSIPTRGALEAIYDDVDEIYASRLELVRRATKAIRFETFFATRGRRADAFFGALMDKAREGVDVKVILDAAGSHVLPRATREKLRAAGVDLRAYGRLRWRDAFDYQCRTHRKVLIVDGEVAQVGGTGVSDDWDGKTSIGDTAPWLDVEMRMRGPVVATMEGVFMQQWNDAGGTASLDVEPFAAAQACDGGWGAPAVVTPGDGPSFRASSMRALFSVSLAAARRRVWLASPYFLPDRYFRRVLCAAARRGVEVKILTNGRKNDMPLVYHVSRETYAALFDAGVEVYEYDPSMMHAKALLIDDAWVSVGSANFDAQSFFHNEELNVSFAGERPAELVEAFFRKGFARAVRVTREAWERRPLHQRAIGRALTLFERQL